MNHNIYIYIKIRGGMVFNIDNKEICSYATIKLLDNMYQHPNLIISRIYYMFTHT